MKKLMIASILGLSSLGLVACSSDDDSTPNGNNNPMVGEWKAQTLSYTIPNGPTHEFPFTAITDGCDVDDIELRANNSAELEVESKVNEVCTEAHYQGSWTEEVVTFADQNPKHVVSVSGNELVLKYEMTYGSYGDIEVTVKYAKQD